MQINTERLQGALEAVNRIGATPRGGVSRPTLSDADRQVRELFVGWLKDAGLQVTIDQMGSIFGRRAGREDTLPPVLFGSHLDSVIGGGRFDGALGVMAALEVIRTLNDHGHATRHSLEIVDFTNEEGVRFQPSMVASGVMAGAFALDFAYARSDREGKRLGDELERIGYKGSAPCRRRPLRAYLELHIEQGPVLEAVGVPVGAVEGILGINWNRVVLTGERDHAGPTPMPMRHDALVVAARIVTAVRDLALRHGGEMVTTVGCLDVEPDLVNVIPGRVVLTVDIREREAGKIRAAWDEIRAEMARLAAAEGVALATEELMFAPPTTFASEVVGAVEAGCRKRGYAYKRMMSGAGHDATYMAQIAPTGMIFVPCKGGKSHCEEEDARWEDIEKGVNVLLDAMVELAG